MGFRKGTLEAPWDQGIPPAHPGDRQPGSARTAPATGIAQVPGLWAKNRSECWKVKMPAAAQLMAPGSEIGSWTMGQGQKKQGQ